MLITNVVNTHVVTGCVERSAIASADTARTAISKQATESAPANQHAVARRFVEALRSPCSEDEADAVSGGEDDDAVCVVASTPFFNHAPASAQEHLDRVEEWVRTCEASRGLQKKAACKNMKNAPVGRLREFCGQG